MYYGTVQVVCIQSVYTLLVDSLPPLNIFVDPTLKPMVVHRPAQVLIHFVDEVREGLGKGVHIGVLESVPENTLTTWCSWMCVVVKKNRSLQ